MRGGKGRSGVAGGGGAAGSGLSPTAKRPRDVGTFVGMDTGNSQGTRVLSTEDLTAGFNNLVRLQTRDAQFAKEIALVTEHNAPRRSSRCMHGKRGRWT